MGKADVIRHGGWVITGREGGSLSLCDVCSRSADAMRLICLDEQRVRPLNLDAQKLEKQEEGGQCGVGSPI